MTADRGRETSGSLIEIRTVLSRAETARVVIARRMESARGFRRETGEILDVEIGGRVQHIRQTEWVETEPAAFDPDREEMLAALDAFIAAAQKWKRTGRPLKS